MSTIRTVIPLAPFVSTENTSQMILFVTVLVLSSSKTCFFILLIIYNIPHNLGLNPHNFSGSKNSEENKIIIPAIKKIKSNKINVVGPISADTSFIFNKGNRPDVIIGMYHDQVLAPFKTLFKYNAINITLGLPFLRVSPDHGVAKNIVGKNIANPKSLIEAIKFFNLTKH